MWAPLRIGFLSAWKNVVSDIAKVPPEVHWLSGSETLSEQGSLVTFISSIACHVRVSIVWQRYLLI